MNEARERSVPMDTRDTAMSAVEQIEKLFTDAKDISDEDVSRICSVYSVSENMNPRVKSGVDAIVRDYQYTKALNSAQSIFNLMNSGTEDFDRARDILESFQEERHEYYSITGSDFLTHWEKLLPSECAGLSMYMQNYGVDSSSFREGRSSRKDRKIKK